MPAQLSETTRADVFRFLVAGAVNTALTAAVYFVCLTIASPTSAYAIAWLTGLCFVMIFYPDRVFVGGRRSVQARLLMGLLTAAVFLTGIVVLRLFLSVFGDARIAFLITLALTTVLNFVGGRMLLRRGW